MSRGSRFALLALAQALLLACDWFWIERERVPLLHAALLAAASIPWLWLCWRVFRHGERIPLRWILVAAIVMRVLAQFATPSLSDDLYRYVWEGRIQHAGHNPFLHAPSHPEVAAPGDPIWERVNNKSISAAYPPVCQLWLRLLTAIEPSLAFVRSGFALCEALLLFLLVAWLAQLGLDRSRCVVLALCPVAIVEWSAEGHNDALAAMLLVASFVCFGELRGRLPLGRLAVGGALFGAAVAAKLLPVLIAPWLLRRDWRIALPALLVFVLSLVPYWPGFENADSLLGGVSEFGARWRHNDSLFALVHEATRWLQESLRAGGSESWLATGELQRVSKLPLLVLFGLGCAWIFWRRPEPGAAWVPLLTLLFALSPVLHPWYVVWCVPFLALRPSPALFALLALCSLSHHTLARWHAEGVWEEQALWKWVEYAPFYALLAWQCVPRAWLGFRRAPRVGESGPEER